MSYNVASRKAFVVDAHPMMCQTGFDEYAFKPVVGTLLDELLDEVMGHA